MLAGMASYSNISVAPIKDAAYASSSSQVAEYSQSHLCLQPLGVNNDKTPINSDQNDARSECLGASDLHEGRGTATKLSVKSVNPASKASFAERCRELMASHDTTLSESDDNDDEIRHNDEPSDISPMLPNSPAELFRDNHQIKPTESLADNGQLRPPSKLLGYDGKRRPAALLECEGQSSHAAELYEDDGQLKSPTELLGYDGKKRSSPSLLGYDDKQDCRTGLLGGDIRDGGKSRPPPGTWARIKKHKALNSKKTGSGTTATSSTLREEKISENDILGSSTAEQSLPNLIPEFPEQPKSTGGSLEIEVIPAYDSSLSRNSLK